MVGTSTFCQKNYFLCFYEITTLSDLHGLNVTFGGYHWSIPLKDGINKFSNSKNLGNDISHVFCLISKMSNFLFNIWTFLPNVGYWRWNEADISKNENKNPHSPLSIMSFGGLGRINMHLDARNGFRDPKTSKKKYRMAILRNWHFETDSATSTRLLVATIDEKPLKNCRNGFSNSKKKKEKNT